MSSNDAYWEGPWTVRRLQVYDAALEIVEQFFPDSFELDDDDEESWNWEAYMDEVQRIMLNWFRTRHDSDTVLEAAD